MQTTRHIGAGLAAAILGLAVFAGCGGSSTRATPLAPVPTTTTTTKATRASAPTASQLAAVQGDLAAAGSSLDASDNAISGADVDQAKTQEGSAP